ncbi:MAG: FliH/SctL family protein [Pseudomonadota bacterium]|nr:FliH/SctL family protein [Pseudomonadota bacterium]
MSELRGRFTGAAPVERWQLPEVSGPVIELADARRRSDNELRQAQQQAEERGYQAGMERAEAHLRARLAAIDERVQRLDSVLALIARPLDSLDAEVERELVELALAVGKQLARRELRTEPSQIIAIVRESLAQLPLAAREVRVHLHPEDAQTVRERLAAGAGERAWTLIEDPTLTRGGCLVQSEASRIDARIESRIAAIAANALGDERTAERSAAPQTP